MLKEFIGKQYFVPNLYTLDIGDVLLNKVYRNLKIINND